MRSRSTIAFLGLWEEPSNVKFNPLEFDRFRTEAGGNYLGLSTALDCSHTGSWHHEIWMRGQNLMGHMRNEASIEQLLTLANLNILTSHVALQTIGN